MNEQEKHEFRQTATRQIRRLAQDLIGAPDDGETAAAIVSAALQMEANVVSAWVRSRRMEVTES